jgi:hypothetical protein
MGSEVNFFCNNHLKPTSGAIITTLPAAGSTVCTAATITSLSPLFTLSVNMGRAESDSEIENGREEKRRGKLQLKKSNEVKPNLAGAVNYQNCKEIK